MRRLKLLALFLIFVITINAQNTGIGTATPLAPLHVKTTGPEVIRIEGDSPYMSLYDNSSGYRGYFWSSPANKIELGSANGSNLPVTIAPNQTVSATFLTNGNIGFGTSTPNSALHILGSFSPEARIEANSAFGSSSVTLKMPGGTNDYLRLVKNGTSASGSQAGINLANLSQIVTGADGGGLMIGNVTNNPVYLLTDNTERIRITGNGNVGIGNTSPDASALLDMQSTDKGILIPRMTSVQKNSIANPVAGLLVFQTDANPGFYYNANNGSPAQWKKLDDNSNPGRSAYASAGSYSFIVPAGITSIHFEMVGGGGGYGGSYTSGSTYYGGGGGGGGGFASGTITVTPGETLDIIVGNGGSAGTSSPTSPTNGTSGAASIISSGGSPLITANGGQFGSAASASASGAGGTGGNAVVGNATRVFFKPMSGLAVNGSSGYGVGIGSTIAVTGAAGFPSSLGEFNQLTRTPSFVRGTGLIGLVDADITVPSYGLGGGYGSGARWGYVVL